MFLVVNDFTVPDVIMVLTAGLGFINIYLYTADMPDVDLLIRCGGEQRLSNFLMWQAAYAELYFTDVLWPDFGKNEVSQAIAEYLRRNRRFGGLDAGVARDE